MACHSRTRYSALAVGVRPASENGPVSRRSSFAGQLLKRRVAAQRLKQIANGGMGHVSRLARQQFFDDVGGGIAGFERQRHHFSAGGFHFFASGDEVRPIRAFDQDVGQDFGDQLARRVFVEESDRVHGFERQRHLQRVPPPESAGAWALSARDARVGVQRQNQHVAQRSRLFQKPDMAGMQNVVTAVGEDHGLSGAPPLRRAPTSSGRV